ncbi:hypothetical protein FS842_006770 [Serendipita sp. 407]|nr:hypothetical protein FS842_006770 [Serendipita sp. 407]
MPSTAKDKSEKSSDIRGFFGNSQDKSSTQTKGRDSLKAGSSKKSIEISDDDDE